MEIETESIVCQGKESVEETDGDALLFHAGGIAATIAYMRRPLGRVVHRCKQRYIKAGILCVRIFPADIYRFLLFFTETLPAPRNSRAHPFTPSAESPMPKATFQYKLRVHANATKKIQPLECRVPRVKPSFRSHQHQPASASAIYSS